MRLDPNKLLGYASLTQHSRTSEDRSFHLVPGGYPGVVRHIDLRSILADADARPSMMRIIAQIQYKANHGLLAIDSMKNLETKDLAEINDTLAMADGVPQDRVLSMTATPSTRVPVAVSRKLAPLSDHISPSGAYVLVGAFGGVGEIIADLLVRGGAKSLVFLSRRGANSPGAQVLCTRLRERGVEVVAYAVDVADEAALKAVWKSIVQRVNVSGVVQCAAVFKV